MNIKFVIFVTISAILGAAIYSSSILVVFAATTQCGQSKINKKQQVCSVTDESGVTFWRCTKHNNGSWSCVQETKAVGSSNITSVLSDAIVKAKGGLATDGTNNTNVFKSGSLLKDRASPDNNTSTEGNNTLQ